MRWFIRGFACFAFLATVLVIAGGGTKTAVQAAGQKKDDKKKDDHHEVGPHGGPVAEWGDEKYHAEFTVDREKKTTTVYILDGSVKKASPIAAESIKVTITNFKTPIQITLKADPEKGDPKGSSSRFVGMHDKLAEKVLFKGQISGKVGDLPYAGKFEEKAKDKK